MPLFGVVVHVGLHVVVCIPGGVGCTQFVHGRSRMTLDPRIPTMPGRSTSGFHQPGALLAPSAKRQGRGYEDFKEPWAFNNSIIYQIRSTQQYIPGTMYCIVLRTRYNITGAPGTIYLVLQV